ncbi:Tripeptidyl-peptidase sed2 [Favolaschia claudopus]|uniref:Tripeptidyl-peptidase sed2 n=1 Tax=Favolaschia claudopus TaxID=2862362 RepID=A0AAW0DTR6_9AGAR
MWARNVVSVLAFSALALALPSQNCEHKVKETIVPPRGWTIFGPAPPDHLIKLRIGLPQSNFDLLEEHLYAISDPYHDRYGAHLTTEEIHELVAPHPDSVGAVENWLASHAIADTDITRSAAGDWLTVTLPVNLVEKMLDTKYHIWHKNGEYIVRTTSYSLPKNVHDHVELVQPTTMFGTFRKLKSTIHSVSPITSQAESQKNQPFFDSTTGLTVDASCNTTITITCLQQIYNAVGYTPSANVGNSIGIAAYLEDFANRADLQTFFEDQVPAAAAANATYQFISVKDGLDSQDPAQAGAESALDTQFAFGLTFPVASTFFSTGGRPPFIPSEGTPTDTNEPYTDWLDFVLSHPSPPLSISTSYGDEEQTVPESFAKRACAEFAQLVFMPSYGSSLIIYLFLCADGGVGDGDPDPETTECITNDGLNRVISFLGGFPASCPFVTAVGGTILFPEQGVDFSGGGYCYFIDAAVQAFLDKLPPGTYSGLFNPNGRAFPDVSAQSDFFRIFIAGQPFHIGGTSASSPAFAGFVALLNDARLRKGLPSLGFLNPLFYSKAAAGFNDITVGNNPGCGTPGFNVRTRFELSLLANSFLTGLGTPNFGKLVKLVT